MKDHAPASPIAFIQPAIARKPVPDDDGFGITIQPKNSQIAPVEVAYMLNQGVQRVSMLVDPSAFTVGMANRVQTALEASGVIVERVQIEPGATNYGVAIGAALAGSPDLIYVSTYYPEGSVIARGLAASGSTAQRFMGLANVDPAFVTQAGLEAARTCVFSGVPEAAQLPTA
jgi:branched-chain amino acid transport system substrate-binding protein